MPTHNITQRKSGSEYNPSVETKFGAKHTVSYSFCLGLNPSDRERERAQWHRKLQHRHIRALRES